MIFATETTGPDFPQMVVNCKGNPRKFQGNRSVKVKYYDSIWPEVMGDSDTPFKRVLIQGQSRNPYKEFPELAGRSVLGFKLKFTKVKVGRW